METNNGARLKPKFVSSCVLYQCDLIPKRQIMLLESHVTTLQFLQFLPTSFSQIPDK